MQDFFCFIKEIGVNTEKNPSSIFDGCTPFSQRRLDFMLTVLKSKFNK